MIVVIPTAREIRLDYLGPLIDAGARFVVVDDSEGRVTVPHPSFRVFTWKDQRDMLGPRAIAIPRRNGASRDFGFYVAWRESNDDEIIVALDDDCCIERPDFAVAAAAALSERPRPVASVAGQHLNIIDCYDGAPDNLFPRGFPYSARPGWRRCGFNEMVVSAPLFSLGLWQGIFDVNAVDKLKGPPFQHPEARLLHESVVIASGKLVSVCSMNMVFRREVLPAVYQLPMHVETVPGWVVDRYGDIWGGFILKTLMDLRGDPMVAGAPLIRHLKEGSIERNIWQEHLCHLVNDEFLESLAVCAADIRPARYEDMMGALAVAFARDAPGRSDLLRPYLEHLARSLEAWAEILIRTPASPPSN